MTGWFPMEKLMYRIYLILWLADNVTYCFLWLFSRFPFSNALFYTDAISDTVTLPYWILWLFFIQMWDESAIFLQYSTHLQICFLLNHPTWFKNANKHPNYCIRITPSFLSNATICLTEPPESISYNIAILLLLNTVTKLDTVTICPCPVGGHSIR